MTNDLHSARDRLIAALDVPTVDDADNIVETLDDAVTFYKIGYQLVFSGGLALAERLAASGNKVFLDVKLHDIGNTVAHAVANIATLGVTFVTVHAYPQTMRAAVEGRGDATLKVLGVTVLTSYDAADLEEAGYGLGVEALVARRAAQAAEIGIDGLVCSPMEVGAVRNIVGDDFALVTPGVRPAGGAIGDQKRIATPAEAIAAGADHLVVGRPVIAATDPKAAAEAIVAEIAEAARRT
ncbi:MAG: orotidine-5'-phosphate decarboxylase [Hyphomicrobiales bacterium]|nr:orotidine-5'-phosphate decarboxylase [Hyphomicrobiales bacterium]